MPKVLVVDDDLSTVKFISILLKCERMEVMPAYDVEQALNA